MNAKEFNIIQQRYLSALQSADKSDCTIATYKRCLWRFSGFLTALDQSAEITPLTIVGYRTALNTQGLTTNSVKQYLVILHGFFEWCVRMEICDKNPVHEQEIPNSKQIEYDLLSFEEIEKLLHDYPKGLPRNTLYRNRAIVIMLLTSGLRNSELRDLRLADLDFEQGTINVLHGKGDKMRVVPFPQVARDCVAEYLEQGCRPLGLADTEPLFGTTADETGLRSNSNTWHKISSQGLLQAVRRYTHLTCGHSVKTHSLRHSATALMDFLGVPIRTVQQTLGHASVSLTEKTYTYVLKKDSNATTVNSVIDNFILNKKGVRN